MDFTILLTVLGAITAGAGAVKGLQFFWNMFGKLKDFTESASELSAFQAETRATLTELKDGALAAAPSLASITDIRDIVDAFSTTVGSMSQEAVEMAIATFKANTVHSHTASYIIASTPDGGGEFIWANPAWYSLLGISYAEAVIGAYWNCISPEDQAKAKAASDSASKNRHEFRVSYANINQATSVKTRVQAQAWPLIPYGDSPSNSVVFLGAIKDLGQDIEADDLTPESANLDTP